MFNPFNRRALFNRCVSFKPPPSSSPATRGRMMEGVKRFERLELFEQAETFS
jgi:hypothetical protein